MIVVPNIDMITQKQSSTIRKNTEGWKRLAVVDLFIRQLPQAVLLMRLGWYENTYFINNLAYPWEMAMTQK